MTLKKVVNGVEMDMSPEEEAATLAEWKANEETPKVETKSLQQQIDELKAAIGK
jgi:hypothetical protein